MILDLQQLLSDAQALTATAVSTNTIDFGNVTPKNDPGAGEPMALVITVDVAADTASGNETYTFSLVQSANADLSSNDNLVDRTIAGASLTAGSKHVIPVPPGAITKRYIGAEYTLGGTTPSVTVTAALQPLALVENRKQGEYASGYTVS